MNEIPRKETLSVSICETRLNSNFLLHHHFLRSLVSFQWFGEAKRSIEFPFLQTHLLCFQSKRRTSFKMTKETYTWLDCVLIGKVFISYGISIWKMEIKLKHWCYLQTCLPYFPLSFKQWGQTLSECQIRIISNLSLLQTKLKPSYHRYIVIVFSVQSLLT